MEISILPVKPGTMSEDSKHELKKAGVLVIEHDDPGSLRLLQPRAEIPAGDLLGCALSALAHQRTSSGAGEQREKFAFLVAELFNATHGR